MATRWSPDTCACVVEYDGFDGDKPIKPKVISVCETHGDGGFPETPRHHHELVARVLEHNRAHKCLDDGRVVKRDHQEG